MIGGDKATLFIYGKKNPMYIINLPRSLIKEIENKSGPLKHRERLRVWLETTGLVQEPKPYSFKKKMTENNTFPK